MVLIKPINQTPYNREYIERTLYPVYEPRTDRTSEEKRQEEKTYSDKLTYSNVTINTSVTQILAKNPSRKTAIIINTSTSVDIFIGGDRGVTSSTGFRISAGSAYEFNQTNLYRGEVFAVTSSSTADVRYMEY